MGPIMLDIDNGHLMDDWEQASRQEVSDYKAGASEVCINETWIKEPPNALIFTLNRVKYDKKTHKLVKDFRKFEFDKIIYADQLLEGNIGRIDGVRERTRRLKTEIKTLRAQLDAHKQDKTLEHLQQSISFLQAQILRTSTNGDTQRAAEEELKEGEQPKKVESNLWDNLEVGLGEGQLVVTNDVLTTYKTAIERNKAAIVQ